MYKIPDSILHLDQVLRFIARSHFAKAGVSFDFILEKVKPAIVDGDELKMIIKKLRKDEYIDITPVPSYKNDGSFMDGYVINIDGVYFDQLDGYSGKIRSQQSESETKEKINKLTAIAAWGTAVASVIAFLVLIWTVIAFGFDHHWFCHHHCH